MNEDEITQQTDESKLTPKREDEIVTGDYSLDAASESSSDEPLTHVEEFSVLEFLGKGGFGAVYRAYDSVLQREVALKVPHRRLVNRVELAAAYLREARAMARLDHPHIVPVYRAAETKEVACYLVTKLIRGCHFGQWIRRHHPSYKQLADVFRCVAEALAYAHSRGIVHRDVKPGNILIDDNDCPYVVDFGLALRDIEREGRSAYIGTPAYMSPEQARGEGHRVDGRSDIFSLGTVIYQSLTDSRPFKGDDRDSLFQDIIYNDPIPPRELDPNIPPELARICLKSLSKSIHDRYASCESLVDDLKHYIDLADDDYARPVVTSTTDSSATSIDEARRQHRRVIPKGLRPFDLRDADHFLRLLPGPYDREGLPDIVRFWLARIQCDDPASAIPIGLIYGPSGCGKTSLVRAGIIPRLSNHCTTIYLQATPDATESTLITAIKSKLGHQASTSDSASDVTEMVAQLRRGGHNKVVIFIDQFEQWLFSHPEVERESLTGALRQCDGVNVQCILMVRDDFWLGISRLMQSIDLPIAENENATLLDLFDTRHARDVLSLFGAAYERLPDSQKQLSPSQNVFLDSAVRYLANDGRVICVQLALLTEMLKNRDWDAASDLFKDGGTGIGVKFLDETFDNERSPRRIRLFSDGAERVLRALLPDTGSSIKGAVRTEQELMSATGYRDKSAFRRLIAVLDGELHLITPTDRTEDDSFSSESSIGEIGTTGYQLTHDFLIAPIRHWVELRNRTTRAGKARLRLEEFTELYRARPLAQALPTLNEYLTVRRHIPPASYSDDQLSMMSAAKRYHLGRIGMWLLVLGLIVGFTGGGYAYIAGQIRKRDSDSALARLLGAELNEAIPLSRSLRNDPWIRERASTLIANPETKNSVRVRAALVGANDDIESGETLINYALSAPADDVVQIAKDVVPSMRSSADIAVNIWKEQTASRGELVRSACLIANDPDRVSILHDPNQQALLFHLLMAENPVWSESWGRGFMPLADELLPHLAEHLAQTNRDEPSLTAVNLVRQFAGDDFDLMSRLVRTTQPSEFNLLLESLESAPERALAALEREWEDATLGYSQRQIDVTRPWGSPWWVVGNRAPVDLTTKVSFDDSLTARLLAIEAVVAPHAIMAHRVPESDFETFVEELAGYGYRVSQAAPVDLDGSRHFFVLWIRDSLESTFSLDLTAEEVVAKNTELRQQRLLIDSVYGYANDDQAVRYFASWIPKPRNGGVVDADLYIEVPSNDHESKGWRPMLEKGISLPRFNLCIERPDQSDLFTSVRWKTASNVGYSDAWNQPQIEFRDIMKLNRSSNLLVGGSSLSGDGRRSGAVTPIWWRDIPIESRMLDLMGRRDHLRAAQKMLDVGFYPVSVDAAAFGDDATFQFQSVWWRGLPDIGDKVADGRVRCNLALAQLRLKEDRNVKAALNGELGEEMRGAVVAGFADFKMAPEWLIEKISESDEPNLVRGCLMAMKLIPIDQASLQQRSSIESVLSQILSTTTDPGIRSASLALASVWQLDIQLPPSRDTDLEFTTSTGQRMVVVRPRQLEGMGSDGNEPGRDGQKEPRTAFEIDHDFAIATTEVTARQFKEFRDKFEYATNYAPTEDCPAIGVTWYDAAKYCRWLSDREGIPKIQMCYPEIDKIKPGMVIPHSSIGRTGYRLATEAEWECACRGGIERNRWFGFDPNRLDDHAWTVRNSEYRTHPVRSLLPNDYGLFDMLGNAMEWCHTPGYNYPQLQSRPARDSGYSEIVFKERMLMQVRGGAMLYQPADARASQRNIHGASTSWVYIGFRIARTIPKTP